MGHFRVASAVLLGCAVVAAPSSAEVIRPEFAKLSAQPGEILSVHWLLDESSTPLFGYSLALAVTSSPGVPGDVAIDESATNFFDTRNLITAGGATRDPFFSVILSDADGGVFISTNTDDLSTVLAVAGVNDVLAEVVFTIAPGAPLGEYVFGVQGNSALSDGQGFPVAYMSLPLSIIVVPAPAATELAAAVLAISGRRRRRAHALVAG